jgi:hypothetical protein
MHCDACGKRLREHQHELLLRDLFTGQVLGHYHAGAAWDECMAQAGKYISRGAALQATFIHPDRCGDEQEHCDAGLSELVA